MSKESQPRYCSTKYCKRIATHGYYCKTCVSRKWREAHPYEDSFNNLKQNAKRRGIKFTITLEYWKKWCDKNDYLRLRGTGADDMTVDRDKAWLGYEPGNLKMLTKKENTKKQAIEQKVSPEGRKADMEAWFAELDALP